MVIIYKAKNCQPILFDCPVDNPLELYGEFIKKEAESRSIVINEFHYNIANEEHNSRFNRKEYRKQAKSWIKYLRVWNFARFAIEKLNATTIDYDICYS